MQASALSSEELVPLAIAKNDEAIVELHARTHALAVRYAHRVLRNYPQMHEQFTWDVTDKIVFVKLGLFNGESRYNTWAIRIIINEALMVLRKIHVGSTRNPANYVSVDDKPEDMASYDIPMRFVSPDVAMDVNRLLAKMPAQFRVAVEMQYMQNLPQREAAAMLGISIPAFKSRVLRGREHARLYFNPDSGLSKKNCARRQVEI